MVGCSNGDSDSWISSDGTSIYIDGKAVLLTSFDGTRGAYDKEGDPASVTYGTCVTEVRDCPQNRQGVHEGDLSTYKKSQYFDAYINSFSVMHIPLNDTQTKEITINTTDSTSRSLESVRPSAYDTVMALKFEPLTSATFGSDVVVNANGSPMTVEATCIKIPGVLAVSVGTKDCTQQVEINGVTCMKYESNNYDFYQYGTSIIKVKKGVDVNSYITLKVKE